MTISNLGLLLIVSGWAYQAWSLIMGDRAIRSGFAGLYALGVLLLMINARKYVSLDGLSFAIAIAVFILTVKKK